MRCKDSVARRDSILMSSLSRAPPIIKTNTRGTRLTNTDHSCNQRVQDCQSGRNYERIRTNDTRSLCKLFLEQIQFRPRKLANAELTKVIKLENSIHFIKMNFGGESIECY